MITLLHTADIHLDSPLKSLALRDAALGERVQTATRTAFARIVDAALEHEVSGVLIAGDLFDGAERSARTAAFLIAQLDRLKAAGIAVYYIKGNHDAENPITGELSLPDTVHVFDGRGGKVQLPRQDVWIHGVSFSGRHAPESLLPKFGAPVAGAVNIAMLHTSLGGAAGHDTYAPCSASELANMGFDYWALGHIHKRQVHGQAPWIVMPGIPQGRDIGEAGPKTATLIKIEDGQIALSEVPTASVEFAEARLNCAGFEREDGLRAALRDVIRDAAGALQAETGVLRLTLHGETALNWAVLRDQDQWRETIAELAAETGRVWIDKVLFDLSDPKDAAESASAVTELGRLMADIRDEPAFREEMAQGLATLLGETTPARRAALAPNEAAAEALADQLAESGAAAVLAAMKGAAE
ncbi:metallophosphoesterase family protein [Pacificoceanicola onchidii]|uniref:metallophosphoesterase family protein n=1 Tax=Pacificoceanicola onchidii TaxID=2562685 RepID=UPI0010A37851|nr:DNA repair exonuclease [Pacificoceanicola onchidii]